MQICSLRGVALRRAALSAPRALRSPLHVRTASSVSQRPNSDFVSFPGALKSAFTSKLSFETPETYTALPTYRVVDQHGVVVDSDFQPDLSDEAVVKLYTDMLYISILDMIMFDAQRQGRVSFYAVSAGEEAVAVGSSSVLDPQDVMFCQYREQGVFRERGWSTKEFMDQLFANRHDQGKGRNMPVHYGSKELNIVSAVCSRPRKPLLMTCTAHHLIATGYATTAGCWSGLRAEDATTARPQCKGARSGGLLWRGLGERG
jgi:2-oxoisovalerate dehydrogenase E1 component alpha subunit